MLLTMKVFALLMLFIGVSLAFDPGFAEEDIVTPKLRYLKKDTAEELLDVDSDEVNHVEIQQIDVEEDDELVDVDDEETSDDEEASDDDNEDDEEALDEDEEGVDDEESEVDPCETVTCKLGRECYVLNGEGRCRCISECPEPLDDDETVCGNDNITYPTVCDLHRTKCTTQRDNVQGKKHLRVNYYGPCKDIGSCNKQEMSEFPTRMRSWVKNIYLQFYDLDEDEGGLNDQHRYHGRKLSANRDRLNDFEQQPVHVMAREFEKFYPLYVYPVHWKFAMLDTDPADKYLSRSEVEPLSAMLIPLEHCARDFFKSADTNKDHMISLYEWGVALGIKEEDMDLSLAV